MESAILILISVVVLLLIILLAKLFSDKRSTPSEEIGFIKAQLDSLVRQAALVQDIKSKVENQSTEQKDDVFDSCEIRY